MKKLISFFTVLAVVIAAAVIVFPASGEQNPGGKTLFALNDVSDVVPGEPFTVTLNISDISDDPAHPYTYAAHGMNLSIMYDPTSLVLEQTELGSVLMTAASSGNLVQVDDTTLLSQGKIKIGVICPINPISATGDVLTMRFHVKEGVTVNQQVLISVDEFIYLPLGSMTSTSLPFVSENSVITLRNGSVPDGGYNEGGEEPIPTSPYSSAEPGTQTTPQPMTTPEISIGTPAPTAAPVETREPATKTPDATPGIVTPGIATPEPTIDPIPSMMPINTADIQVVPGSETTAVPTPAPGADGTQAPDKGNTPKSDTTKTVVICCVAGALVLAGGAAAALVISGKKKNAAGKTGKNGK